MAKRKLLKELIKKEDIYEEMVLIQGSDTDYITPSGNVYKEYYDCLFYKKKPYLSKNGYVYVNITFRHGNLNRRLHRLLAEAFIENPLCLPIVGHKNNNKSDYRLENLYWTTLKENTQKAVEDNLMINKKGIDDSQSYPIACYSNDGVLKSVYGSISEASRCIDGFTKSTISKSVKTNVIKSLKGFYFRKIDAVFYRNTPEDKKGVVFKVEVIKKHKITFKAISPKGEEFIYDNQKQFSRDFNISQAHISMVLRKENGGYINGWFFKKIEKEYLNKVL